MARKVQDPSEATTAVNIADFQRTRDSVIVALATLQSSVRDLSHAYINHANTVLHPGRSGALDSNLTQILTDSGLIGGVRLQVPEAPAAVEEPASGEKKKRKRAKHDPNAPKRALTPYFLYMQSARSQIARELGDNAKPKEVADEGTRRWGEMKPEDKIIWDELYQANLAVYRVKMAAYKAGQPVPDDKEAKRLVEAGKAPPHIPEAEDEEEAEVEVEEIEEESSPEPVKEPTPPKSNKRRKTEKAPSPAKETPKSATKPAEKKAKKSKKEATPPPAAAATPKKASAPKGEKKKSKKAA